MLRHRSITFASKQNKLEYARVIAVQARVAATANNSDLFPCVRLLGKRKTTGAPGVEDDNGILIRHPEDRQKRWQQYFSLTKWPAPLSLLNLC